MSMRYYKRRLAEAQKSVVGGSETVATPTVTSESVVEKVEVKPKRPGRPSKK